MPNDVPFGFDPNLCMSDVIGWVVTEPNVSVTWTMSSMNRTGLRTYLYAQEAVVQRLGTYVDPNGWVQEFQVGYTPRAEGVTYLDVTATDLLGQYDRRTVLVLAVKDDPPVIRMDNLPVVRMRQAQRLWQYAKKQNTALTSPTKVWK